jgi:formylglycine-generating enzyme required for sulfatase activity
VNAGAQFYIPTENEWYKAAYYKSGGTNAGYWGYTTKSNTAPGNAIGSLTNQANYFAAFTYAVTQSSTTSSSQNYLTNVGAFTNSASAYGTFDQGGNVYEWNDLTGAAGSTRGIRGGYWYSLAIGLSSSSGGAGDPSLESYGSGFRLASPLGGPSGVPEIDPAGMGTVLALVAGTLAWLERRRLAA